MPRGTGTRQEEEDDKDLNPTPDKIMTTPPDIEGAVTVVTEQPASANPGKNLIKVKGAGKDRKVVLWEKDKDHPNGEVFVCNDGREYIVSHTAAVKRLIADGSLLRVNWNS